MKNEGYGIPLYNDKKTSGGAQITKFTFSFNAERGTLNSRTTSLFSWNESFGYDNLDRLTTFNDPSGSKSQTYDTKGRITNNSALGTYVYSGSSYRHSELNVIAAAQPHYEDRPLQQISYNAFKSPVEIIEDGHERINFQYNASLGRAHMYYGGEETDRLQRRYRKHYSSDGSMEITHDTQTGKTIFVTYIGGDAYSAPAIWREEHTASTAVKALYYLHRDYLGSILAITDASGTVKEKRHFDAWGNIVKLTDGSGNALDYFVILDRGYTGHEHLIGVGLVHMNGRLYDPMLHRFLSPDNHVQDPFNTQNFNRFAYALNNPLMYTDPSGELAFLIPLIGILVKGAAIAVTANGINNLIHNRGFFENSGRAALFGALGGGIAFGIGAAVASINNVAVSIAVQAGAHALSGGAMSKLSGGDFWSGVLAGGLSSFVGWGATKALQNTGSFWRVTGIIGAGALSGGVGSWLARGSFIDGVRQGTITAGLNHLAHSTYERAQHRRLIKRYLQQQEDLKYHSKAAFIYDGHMKADPLQVALQAGQHVRVEIKNMNYLGVQLDLQDISSYTYKKTWFGTYRKVYVGENQSFALLPGQTKTFDFYKFDYAPMVWSFELGTHISSAANVQLTFYSTWVPGMPYDPNHPLKK